MNAVPIIDPRLDALRDQLARRVVLQLDSQAQRLPHDIGERLRVAREQAVRRARESRLVEAAAPHAVAVRTGADGSVALGLPPPPEAPLHEPAAWSLSDSDGASALTLESMRRFVYVPLPSNRADPFYAPPAQLGRRPQRVAWIRVSAGGFVLPAEPGASSAP